MVFVNLCGPFKLERCPLFRGVLYEWCIYCRVLVCVFFLPSSLSNSFFCALWCSIQVIFMYNELIYDSMYSQREFIIYIHTCRYIMAAPSNDISDQVRG